jgi:dihydrofolate reductase
VTHEPPTGWPFPDAPFTFVTDGLASAIAQASAAAGTRDVSLTGGSLLGQALAAGLVDELEVALVPVVFGRGIRFFGGYDGPAALLGNPTIVQGDRVTHLRYEVRR